MTGRILSGRSEEVAPEAGPRPRSPGQRLLRTVAERRAAARQAYQAEVATRNRHAQQAISRRTRYRALCRQYGDAAVRAIRGGRRVEAWMAAVTAAHYGRLALGQSTVLEG